MEYETKQILVEDIDEIDSADFDKSVNNASQVKFYLNIFKRKWFIILAFLLSGIIPAYFWSILSPVYYAGTFEMLIEPATSEEQLTDPSVIARLGTQNNANTDTNIFGVDYPTILKLLSGQAMLDRVATKVSQKYPQYPKAYLLESFQENLIVERARSGDSRLDTSKIIFVRYQFIDNNLVKEVLNTLANEYIKYSQDERTKNLQSGINFIDQQLPIIELKINQLQEKQEKIQSQYELIEPQVKGESLSTINLNSKQELQQLDAQFRELTVLVNKLQQDLGFTPDEALAAITLSQDPERITLLKQLQDIESQIALESAVLNSTHPKILNLKEQKNNLDNLLVEENSRILRENNIDPNINPRIFANQDTNRLALIQQLVETQNKLETISSRYESLSRNQLQTAGELSILPNVIKEYQNLQREIELNTNILNQLSSQKEALNVDVIQKQTPWEIISQPQLLFDKYGKPETYATNPEKKLALGTFAGLMLGLLVAIAIEKNKDVIYEVSDLKYAFGLPILGLLPIYEKVNQKKPVENTSFFSQQDPSFSIGDSLSLPKPVELSTSQSCLSEIYANLHFRLSNLGKNHHNEVLISSLNPADGQGYLCANLAKIAAEIDRKVLLIDANNFEEEISSYLNDCVHKNSKKISEGKVFTTDGNIDQTTLDQLNIAILTAGRENADLPLSLGSEQTQSTIKSIAQNYDMVLYNTSFFLEIYDVSLLAEQTQGIVMTVRLKQTPLSLLKEAVKKIKTYDLNFLGFVVIE